MCITPRSLILRFVRRHWFNLCGEKDNKHNTMARFYKRDSPTRFFYLHVLHYLICLGHSNGLNYFRFWLRFCGVIRILGLKNWLAGVSYSERQVLSDFYWLAGIWYSREIDSPGFHAPGRLNRWGIIPWGIWLIPQGNLKIWIIRQILNQNRKYFFYYWSGAQVCWNYEEKKLKVGNIIGLSCNCTFASSCKKPWRLSLSD